MARVTRTALAVPVAMWWAIGITPALGQPDCEPELIGSIVGSAREIAVADPMVCVANGEGLLVIDASDAANPALIGSVYIPGVAKHLDVQGDFAYVSATLSRSGSGHPTAYLHVVDLTDPTRPVLTGSVRTYGVARAVAVENERVYAIEAVSWGFFTDSRIWTYDVAEPTDPTRITSIPGPQGMLDLAIDGNLAYVSGREAHVVPSVGRLWVVDLTEARVIGSVGQWSGSASQVAYRDSVAYVGTGQLHLVSVSDPADPSVVFRWGEPDTVGDVTVGDDVAYVVGGQPDGSGPGALQVLDVSEPNAPVLIGTLPLPRYGFDVALGDGVVHALDGAIEVVDVSEPSDPSHLGELSVAGPERAVDVAVDGDIAYVADHGNDEPYVRRFGDGLQAVDIGDPAQPESVGFVPMPGRSSNQALDVALSDNLAYVAAPESLQIVDRTNAADLAIVGGVELPHDPLCVAVDGDIAYVGSSLSVEVVEATDPAQPVVIASLDLPTAARDIAVEGDIALVAVTASGLLVLDVSDPFAPDVIGSLDTVSSSGIALRGDLGAAAVRDGSLQLIDMSDPQAPTLVGSVGMPDSASAVAIRGDLAYVGANRGGLQIVDISDPSDPTVIDSLVVPEFATRGGYSTGGVAVTGDYAYIAAVGAGLQVIDVSTCGAAADANGNDAIRLTDP